MMNRYVTHDGMVCSYTDANGVEWLYERMPDEGPTEAAFELLVMAGALCRVYLHPEIRSMVEAAASPMTFAPWPRRLWPVVEPATVRRYPPMLIETENGWVFNHREIAIYEHETRGADHGCK